MAGEVVYADLNIAPGEGCRERRPRPGRPGCPPWHRTALWASCLGHLLLGAAVVALGSWVYRLQFENVGSQENIGSQKNECLSVGNDNTTLEKMLELRKGLCSSQSSEGEGCKLCPLGWKLNGNKCYWFTDNTSSWNHSREDCENRGAELLVPEDQDELDSISKIPQSSKQFWIGLSSSIEQGWTWLNGSRLDQSWISLSPAYGSVCCGMLKGNKISSELCTEGSRWICQKGSTQL
ncbi:killer cell lectin-like receptor subfamily B member 1B allele C [Porphyrio hochstetteri]